MTEINALEYSFEFIGVQNQEETNVIIQYMSNFISAEKNNNIKITFNTLYNIYNKAMIANMFFVVPGTKQLANENNITDESTIAKLAKMMQEHINKEMPQICDDQRIKVGQFLYDHDKKIISVNYVEDYQNIKLYIEEVYHYAKQYVWREFRAEVDGYKQKDLNNMKELFKVWKIWTEDEKEEKLIKFCEEHDKKLSAKFFPIIAFFDKIPLNFKIFEECLEYWLTNVSKNQYEICRRYFILAIKKDSYYNTNIKIVKNFIDDYEKYVNMNEDLLKKQAERIEEYNKFGKKEFYKKIIS